LTGFVDAIGAVYPAAEVQRCIVHQIRYTTKFVYYKDMKPFVQDLKGIYQALTLEQAEMALDALEEKWNDKYPSSVQSWRNNWLQLSTYFKYPLEMRRMIYTTNQIENFNRQLRKVSKGRTIFPTDDALFKLLYLATIEITKKWSGHNRDWNKIVSQLCIYFDDRIEPADLE
jgi:putative transposase